MPTKKRFLKSVNVNFISLVDKGANQKTIIFKSADTSKNTYQKTVTIIKTDEDQHMVYGIVYSPDEVDTDGDFTTAEVIKEMSYNFMKNRNTVNVDKQHDYEADEGFVAESWLTKKKDPTFPDEPEGSWAVGIKVVKEDTWTKVKSGEITGLSMAGLAQVEPVEETPAEDSFFAKMEKRFSDFLSSLKNGVANIAKDFNSNFNNEQIRQMTWALQDSIWEVIRDESITDKKAGILTNIEQFKAAIDKVSFPAATDTEDSVAKAGKVFNKKNLAALKEMRGKMDAMISQMEAAEVETNKIQKNNNGDEEMKPEEIQELVKNAVAEAVKPLTETITKQSEAIEKMKTDFNAAGEGFEKRLKTVEETSDGSFQKSIKEEIEKGKDGDYKGPRWLS